MAYGDLIRSSGIISNLIRFLKFSFCEFCLPKKYEKTYKWYITIITSLTKLFKIFFSNELSVHSCVHSYISEAEVCCVLFIIMAWVVQKSISWRGLVHYENIDI